MLVLTRKPGERLLIGDDIVVTILDARGDGIRIGIDAPRGIRIHREAVVDAVTAANQKALKQSADADDPERLIKNSLGL